MPHALLATDLDGTLLNSDAQISALNRSSLEQCATMDVVRVVATGRSLYSAQRVLNANTPIDYLIFSSGAGILRWADKQLLYAEGFNAAEAQTLAQLLHAHNLTFMVHAPIPENHRFWYHTNTHAPHPDLQARIEHYQEYVLGACHDDCYTNGVTQFLATFEHCKDTFRRLQSLFTPHAEVIRSTSPFNPNYIWLELFPKGVNKGNAVAWLCNTLQIPHSHVATVGNDYNDLSMLERFPHAYLMANAPNDLPSSLQRVASNNADGVAQAIDSFLKFVTKELTLPS